MYAQVMKEFGYFILGTGDDDISVKHSETELIS